MTHDYTGPDAIQGDYVPPPSDVRAPFPPFEDEPAMTSDARRGRASMSREHRHRAVASMQTVRPYFGAVSERPNRAAHGNVCIVDTCRCGARRRTNANGRHEERGPWIDAEASRDE